MSSDQEIQLIWEELRAIRTRMDGMLSRKGGHMEGGLAYEGNLKPIRSEGQVAGYIYVPLQVVATSVNWNGDAKTTADNGTIDLSVEFGLPANIEAVSVTLIIIDETPNVQARLGASASYTQVLYQRTQVANQLIGNTGIVPCDANGDIYFYCADELDQVHIWIHGYFV